MSLSLFYVFHVRSGLWLMNVDVYFGHRDKVWVVVVLRVCVSLSDERKVFDGASELQLDGMVEESSGSSTVKHDGLLSLTDLSHRDDFPAAPHNGPPLTEMSSPLPVEPSDIKLDPAAGE